MSHPPPPTLLGTKRRDADPVFRPENLLREARRQRRLPEGAVPAICALDPDGDAVRWLRAQGRARPVPSWACYHTALDAFEQNGVTIGMVGSAIGAPFAVLVAEQLFVSGCRLLLSVTSAGRIAPASPPPTFVLIERALRDEGTSHHYLPPAAYAAADPALVALAQAALADFPAVVRRGDSWTTDAPYRETEDAIAAAAAHDVLAVEMEAAALYAFAEARRRAVLCFAHLTNQMAQIDGDFEKGEAEGAAATLDLLGRVARAWQNGG